MTLLPEILNRY